MYLCQPFAIETSYRRQTGDQKFVEHFLYTLAPFTPIKCVWDSHKYTLSTKHSPCPFRMSVSACNIYIHAISMVLHMRRTRQTANIHILHGPSQPFPQRSVCCVPSAALPYLVRVARACGLQVCSLSLCSLLSSMRTCEHKLSGWVDRPVMCTVYMHSMITKRWFYGHI